MQAPYRIAAPPPPEPSDQVDAYEAELRARAGYGQHVLYVLCAAVVGLWLLIPFLDRQRTPNHGFDAAIARKALKIAHARETVGIARVTANDEEDRFREAMLGALDGRVVPGAAHEPCATTLPQGSILAGGKRAFPLLIVAEGDRDLPSPSITAVRADIERAIHHLDSGHATEGILYANALSSRGRLTYDVVLVTSSVKHPTQNNGASFEPGEVAGRAYLYDFAERRITCLGDVRATSSRQVEYSYVTGLSTPAAHDQGPSLTASLDADLAAQLDRALTRGALFKTE